MTIKLERFTKDTAIIEITGTAPLIVHAWSDKARRQMLDKQQGKKSIKEHKNPDDDFQKSRYKFADPQLGDGFPTLAFKSATVTGAGRMFGKAVKMTELRQALNFRPDGTSTDGTMLTRLDGDEPTMREDMVRVGMGTADIRYRAQYTHWKANLTIDFYPHLIDLASVVALVEAGGANGVGEWRPERDGTFGTYEVTAEDTK